MPNRSQGVDRFMEGLNHPLKEGVELLRAAILDSNERITEHINWKAPSFCYGGGDRVTFRLYPEDGCSLSFTGVPRSRATPGISYSTTAPDS